MLGQWWQFRTIRTRTKATNGTLESWEVQERCHSPFREIWQICVVIVRKFIVNIEFDFHCSYWTERKTKKQKGGDTHRQPVNIFAMLRPMFVLLSIQFSRDFMCQKLQTASVTKIPCSTATSMCAIRSRLCVCVRNIKQRLEPRLNFSLETSSTKRKHRRQYRRMNFAVFFLLLILFHLFASLLLRKITRHRRRKYTKYLCWFVCTWESEVKCAQLWSRSYRV